MATMAVETVGILSTKLGRLARLDDLDRSAIASLPVTLSDVPSHRYLARDGQTATTCFAMVAGYACRQKRSTGGGRQIVSFHLAGDILGAEQLMLGQADHSLQTITRASVASFPTAALAAIAHERPTIAAALWRDSLIDASISREWILNVGRRDAKTRVAHLMCEFAVRREVAGLGRPADMELPMTQDQIADATGLTTVHVNRMLRLLAREGVIGRVRGNVIIADWDLMRQVGDFDPAYLHHGT